MYPTESLFAAARRPNALRAATLVTTLAALAVTFQPQPASAFFQSTSLEGAIGHDVSGVWYAVHHTMPEFRIRFEKPEGAENAEDYVPFKVGPVPPGSELAFTGKGQGVAITEITNPRLANNYGIYEGDIIRKINSYHVRDMESWEEGLENAPKVIIVSIRRPALRQSRARILKMGYEAHSATEETADGSETALVDETVSVEVLDLALPADLAAEENRKKAMFWEPTPEEMKEMREGWFKLPTASPLRFFKAENRVVAASHYGPDLASDQNTAGTLFAMILKLDGNPLGGGGQLVDIYGVQEVSEDLITGTYVSAIIAQAPFPISVEFKGAFRMTRLDDLSDKDVEWRAANAKQEAGEEAEDLKSIELAPDVPEDLN